VKRFPLVIWGASGHARVVADIVRLLRVFKLVGFVDDVNNYPPGAMFLGLPVYPGLKEPEVDRVRRTGQVILAFGDCQLRLEKWRHLRGVGFHFATAVHPSAIIAGDIRFGEGTVVAAGVVVNPGTTVGEQVILNTSCSVDHDCCIAEGAHICPGVRLAGGVTVGMASWVGIGTIVREKIVIGSGVTIGAGSLVLRDIPDGAIAYGSPARVVRTSNKGKQL